MSGLDSKRLISLIKYVDEILNANYLDKVCNLTNEINRIPE